jgi:hypothetical protein
MVIVFGRWVNEANRMRQMTLMTLEDSRPGESCNAG